MTTEKPEISLEDRVKAIRAYIEQVHKTDSRLAEVLGWGESGRSRISKALKNPSHEKLSALERQIQIYEQQPELLREHSRRHVTEANAPAGIETRLLNMKEALRLVESGDVPIRRSDELAVTLDIRIRAPQGSPVSVVVSGDTAGGRGPEKPEDG